jgi:hypothetical protein
MSPPTVSDLADDPSSTVLLLHPNAPSEFDAIRSNCQSSKAEPHSLSEVLVFRFVPRVFSGSIKLHKNGLVSDRGATLADQNSTIAWKPDCTAPDVQNVHSGVFPTIEGASRNDGVSE